MGTLGKFANREGNTELRASDLSGVDPTRPDTAFIIMWSVVLAVYLPITSPFTPPFDHKVLAILLGNMVTGYITYRLALSWVAHRHRELKESSFEFLPSDGIYIDGFIAALLVIWLLVYLANIIYSGGLGLIWVLRGQDSGHTVWGIPTVGGFNYLLRCFIGTLLVIRFAQERRPIYLFVWLFLGFCYILELNRGGLFVYLCHTIAITFLAFRVSLKNVLVTGLIILTMGISFSYLGILRGVKTQATDFGDAAAAAFSTAPPGMIDAWLYAVTPIANVNYAARFDIPHNYWGYNTLLPVFPTVLRTQVTDTASVYPIKLIADAYNATSMYGPLVADFGFTAAFVLMALFQYAVAYVYVMARRGYLIYKLMYPPLFTSIALSIFYIYAVSLVVLVYPIVVFWFKHYIERRRALEAQQPAELIALHEEQ